MKSNQLNVPESSLLDLVSSYDFILYFFLFIFFMFYYVNAWLLCALTWIFIIIKDWERTVKVWVVWKTVFEATIRKIAAILSLHFICSCFLWIWIHFLSKSVSWSANMYKFCITVLVLNEVSQFTIWIGLVF